jgi:hypothetical protein
MSDRPFLHGFLSLSRSRTLQLAKQKVRNVLRLLLLCNAGFSRKELDYTDVLKMLADKGISIRVASPKLVMEEGLNFDLGVVVVLTKFLSQAPESYKSVDDVIETCASAGISKKTFKLRPVCVIKG